MRFFNQNFRPHVPRQLDMFEEIIAKEAAN
jgi:hypothetical protein